MPPSESVKANRAAGGRRAVFLDRDGTIVAERYYLADPERVELIEGAAEAMRGLSEMGYALVVVTNQSGIARGLYAVEDFFAVQRRIEELLADQGVRLDGLYYCPHHPDFTGICACRKPRTGMYLEAARELNLDLSRSAYVGDRLNDVLPALSLGGCGFLVRTGYGREQECDAPPEIAVVDDLAEAAERILRLQGPQPQAET